MNSREKLKEIFIKILKLETEARDFYQNLIQKISDKELIRDLEQIKKQEDEHMKIAQQLILLTGKNALRTKKRWKCNECGYIHYSQNPPQSCPSCGSTKSKFVALNKKV